MESSVYGSDGQLWFSDDWERDDVDQEKSTNTSFRSIVSSVTLFIDLLYVMKRVGSVLGAECAMRISLHEEAVHVRSRTSVKAIVEQIGVKKCEYLGPFDGEIDVAYSCLKIE